jgi:four helix bundle protein
MSILLDPDLRAWESTVPRGIRDDLIWKFHTFKVALFLLHLAREDVRRAKSTAGWRIIADQLVRAVTSISANIGEGYGRSTSVDRARFYDMALGSLRESVSWYDASRLHLPPDIVETRIDQLAELRRMLYGAIRSLRHHPPGARIF